MANRTNLQYPQRIAYLSNIGDLVYARFKDVDLQYPQRIAYLSNDILRELHATAKELLQYPQRIAYLSNFYQTFTVPPLVTLQYPQRIAYLSNRRRRLVWQSRRSLTVSSADSLPQQPPLT